LLITVIHFLYTLSLSLSLLSNAGEGTGNPAAQASPRTVEFEWMSLSNWRERHARLVDIAERGEVDLIFLGDSITEGWTWGETSTIFKAAFGKYKTANFGIGGDQTQHVLWRLQNGETGKLSPKLTVLLIGTNNFGHSGHSPEQVSEGVQAIIYIINKHWPASKILLLGVFPYGEKAGNPSRTRVAQTNQLLAALNNDQNIYYYDFGSLFIDERGNIPSALMADFLHPTPRGYRMLAEKLGPVVDQLMNPGDRNEVQTIVAADNPPPPWTNAKQRQWQCDLWLPRHGI
jgi:lysophospholipase L1-like esterase